MTTTTSTQSNPIAPSISSIDPQLLKLLARHQQHLQQQATAKEFLQHAFYFNHPPPNAVATLSPRTHLSNGLSKLNTENSLANLKLSSSSALNNGKLHDQQSNLSPPSLQMKKGLTSNAQAKDAVAFDPWLQPPPGSIIQGPPCIQADTKSSASSGSAATAGLKSETTLSSGERITCFVVGGERRLCLPEILNTVLKDFSLQEINSACERLHIYCSRCTTEQLDILKKTQVLPINAPSCGLITQTDAERLCANLLQLRYKGQLRSVNSSNNSQYERLYSIKVQHKCFGKCSGTLYPTLYVGPQAECIQCDTCQALFSPKTFVSHGHKSEENRICHWGFNSDNWRAYLKIRSVEDNKAREEFELFKEKFSSNAANNQKKRLAQHTISTDCLPTAEKRAKMVPPCTSDNWSSNDGYSFNQSNYGSSRKEGSCSDYSFNNGLPRPNSLAPALPLAVPVESMSSSSSSSSNSSVRPSPSRLGRSNSPVSNESTNSSSITNFNDFSPEGIRHMVESVVPSVRARQQLITYITQLQMNAYAQSSKNNAILNAHHQNEALQLRRENEILRERLAKFEGSHHSSNSSVCSKSSSNDHPHQQHESLTGDSDDVESNVSVHSGSSMVNQEAVVEQPKYFDRKRRLLAAEQHLPTIEIDVPIVKKTSSSKKACLDEIVDSLNQRAQAERDEDEEYRREEEVEEEEDMAECQEDEDETPMKGGKLDDDEETEGMARAQNQSTPPSTTSDREDEETNDDEEEDVDIDEPKLTVDDDH